ncbi:MAG: tetratricopeptide repeat protein [Acidobacteriota bacterium]
MPAPSSSSPSPRPLFTAGLLALLALGGLLFSGALEAPFLAPGTSLLQGTEWLEGVHPLEAAAAAPEGSFLERSTFGAASFVLSHQLEIRSASGHRTVSLVLHLLAGLLLAIALRNLLQILLAPGQLPGADLWALLITALWLLHPLTTPLVLHLEHRSLLLSILFAWLALVIATLRWSGGQPWLSWLGAAAFGASLVDSSLALFLPLFLLAADPLTRIQGARAALRGHRDLYTSWILAAAAVGGTRALGALPTAGPSGEAPLSFFASLAAQGHVAVSSFYRALVFPLERSAQRSLEPTLDGVRGGGPTAAVGIVLLLALLVATLLLARRLLRARPAGLSSSADGEEDRQNVSSLGLPSPGLDGLRLFWLGLLWSGGAVLSTTLRLDSAEPGLEARSALLLAGLISLFVVALGHIPPIRRSRGIAVGVALLLLLGTGALGLLRQQEFDSRETLWRQAVTAQLEHPTARLALARVYSAEGRRSEAEQTLRRWTEDKPENPRAWMEWGVFQSQNGETDAALIAFDEARMLAPEDPLLWNNLGTTLLAQQKPEEAMRAYETAIELGPEVAVSHYHRANVLLQLTRLEEAEAGYREALRLAPEHKDAAYNLAVILLQSQRQEEARPILDDLVQRFPRDQRITTAYVTLRFASGTVRPGSGAAPVPDFDQLFPTPPPISSSGGGSTPR